MPAEERAHLVVLLGGTATPAQKDQVYSAVDQGLYPLVAASVAAGAPAPLALARAANEVATDVEAGRALDPTAFARLLNLEAGGQLSATQAKDVLGDLLAAGGGDPAAIARDKGFEAMSDDSLADIVRQVVDANPEEWTRFCDGDDGDRKKLAGFFTGQVMKATAGKANGKAVAAELEHLRR
jgi:Asp-tRNA(Asn)/Glu-tRNA(Gln) amidotransferase B subunit